MQAVQRIKREKRMDGGKEKEEVDDPHTSAAKQKRPLRIGAELLLAERDVLPPPWLPLLVLRLWVLFVPRLWVFLEEELLFFLPDALPLALLCPAVRRFFSNSLIILFTRLFLIYCFFINGV